MATHLDISLADRLKNGSEELLLSASGVVQGGRQSDGAFLFESKATDGAAALGYVFDTQNALDTNGSKLAAFRNAGIELFSVRDGLDWFSLGSACYEFNQANGDPALQLTINDGGAYQGLLSKTDQFDIYQVDDYTYAGNYDETYRISKVKGADYLSTSPPFVMDVVTSDAWTYFAAIVTQANATNLRWSALLFDGTTTLQQEMRVQNLTKFKSQKNNIRWYIGVSGSSYTTGRNNHIGLDADGRFVGGSGATEVQTDSWIFESVAEDSATAKAYIFDTTNDLQNAAAIHAQWLNQGTELMKLDKDGNLSVAGSFVGAGGAPNEWTRVATAVDAATGGAMILGVTDTSVARTMTLSTVDAVAGKIIHIKDESGGATANNITIDTEGSELIDGQATATISVNYGVLRVYSDGTNWFSL